MQGGGARRQVNGLLGGRPGVKLGAERRQGHQTCPNSLRGREGAAVVRRGREGQRHRTGGAVPPPISVTCRGKERTVRKREDLGGQ